MKKIGSWFWMTAVFLVCLVMVFSGLQSLTESTSNNTTSLTRGVAKSPVTDVKIVYDSGYKTADYTCWSGGYSAWQGTTYNDLNTVKNGGVIRRGTTFTITGTGASASTKITVKGPCDIGGSRPTVTNWNPTFIGSSKWNLTIPSDAPVGDYQIYMDDEYCTLYVVFDVFLTKTPSGMTELQFDSWAYDEDETYDGDDYGETRCLKAPDYVPQITNMHPFDERVIELICSSMGSSTTTPYEAALRAYRIVNARMNWQGGSPVDIETGLNSNTPLTPYYAKLVASQMGETLPAGMTWKQNCENYGLQTTAIIRSMGIPARPVTMGDNTAPDIFGWGDFDTHCEAYIENPEMTLSTYYQNNPSKRWIVFYANDQGFASSTENSNGEGAIDTMHDLYWHATNLDIFGGTNANESYAGYYSGSGAVTDYNNWVRVDLYNDFYCTADNLLTVNLADANDYDYVEGELGCGDRDFFRIQIPTGMTTLDIGFVEGGEYAQIYVGTDSTVSKPAATDYCLKSEYVYDGTNGWGDDRITGKSVTAGSYIYVMIDNAKEFKFANDYGKDGGVDTVHAMAETHHYKVGIGKCPPYVNVISPNNDEHLIQGSSYNVKWNAGDVQTLGASPITIEYSTDPSHTTWTEINGGTYSKSNDGVEAWNVPSTISDTVKVRVTVTDTDGLTGNDVSDNDFKIKKTPESLNNVSSGVGSADNDRFGWNLTSTDVNNDGKDDIVVGAPYVDYGGNTDCGAIYIFFGKASWSANDLNAAIANITIYGSAANNVHFGWSVGNAGNIDGDGYNDIIVGEPDNGNGKTYVMKGRSNTDWSTATGNRITSVGSVNAITGENAGDRFGCSASGAGNVNNSDNDDIVIGAYAYGNDKGKVYIFMGDGSIPASAADAEVILDGENDNDKFGFSVTTVGNVNSDSYDDVIVGAPGYDNGRGMAYTCYGKAGAGWGTENMFTYYDSTNGASADASYAIYVSEDLAQSFTPSSNYRLTKVSLYISAAGTPGTLTVTLQGNSGNVPDGTILASAPSISSGSTSKTWVDFVWTTPYEATAGTMYWICCDGTGTSTSDCWGWQTDNTAATYAGGHMAANGGAPPWTAYTAYDAWIHVYGQLLEGMTKDVYRSGETSASNFGYSVSAVGDVNNDGYDDFAVGAPGYDNNKGRAYVYYVSPCMQSTDMVTLTQQPGDNGDHMVGKDAHICSGKATTNYGSATSMYVGYDATASSKRYKERILIQFDLNDVPKNAVITNAKMKMYVKTAPASAIDVKVYRVTGVWVETTLGTVAGTTWNTQPSNDTTVLGTVSISGTGWYTWDITTLTQGYVNGTYTNYGLKLISPAEDQTSDIEAEIYSSDYTTDHSLAPKIEITLRYPADLTVTGENTDDNFGYSVSSAGDAKGDGINDFVVSAPYNDNSASNAGAVYMFYGSDSLPKEIKASASDNRTYGETSNDNFGFSVSSGNVTGSRDDTITGSAYYGVNDNGKAYVSTAQTLGPVGATATATGPTGVTNNTGVTLTYTYTGIPTSVRLYYTKNANATWTLQCTDTIVDGSNATTITAGDGTYGWIAVAIGGGSTETDPAGGTSAEAYGLILDTGAPYVTAVSPLNGVTGVAITTSISKTFSEAMNNTTVEANFKVYQDGSGTPIAGTYSWAGNQCTFTPSSVLLGTTKYWSNVSTAAKDLAGNPLSIANNTYFITAAGANTTATGPTGRTNNTAVTITYTWTGSPTSVKLYYTKNANATWTLQCTDTIVDGSNVTTITAGDGTYGWIAVAIGGGSTETDPAGGTLAEAYGLILDTDAPGVSTTTPTNTATGVAFNQNIIVTFDEAMNTSVTPTLNQAAGADPGGWSFVGWTGDTVATWSHNDWTISGDVITMQVSGAKDKAGNTMAAPYSWSFTIEHYWLNLTTGWNLITITVDNATISRAGDLVNIIGENCTAISYWNNTLGRFVTHHADSNISNFSIEAGVGYMISVIGNTNITINGTPVVSKIMNLGIGWNSIGRFNKTATNAQALMNDIGSNCTAIAVWNATTQNFDVYQSGGNNFAIEYGEGVLVYMEGEETWTND